MGFFSRLGSKISSGLSAGARLGRKALGSVHRIGNKIATQGGKIVSAVERIPLVGQVLAPATGIARSALGLIKNVSDVAGTGEAILREGEDIIRAGGQALRTGDVQSASEVMRRGKSLIGTSKSTLERAREVKDEAIKVAQRKP